MRRHGFASTARAITRAAAQAERARLSAARKAEVAAIRALRQAERDARADQREAARQYALDRVEEAEQLTVETKERENAISSLLARALDERPFFLFSEAYEAYEAKSFNVLHWQSQESIRAHFLPKKPGFLVRRFSKKYAEACRNGEAGYAAALADHTRQMQDARIEFAEKEECERQRVEAFNRNIDDVERSFLSGEHDAVVYFYKCLLTKSFTEDIDAISAEVGFSRESNHLVVDLELPDFETIPAEAAFKYVKSADRIDSTSNSLSKRRNLYVSLISQNTLKCVDTVFRGVECRHVECLTINGMLDAIDPANGRNIRVCLLSVRITRDDYRKLNLTQVHPEQCLKMLKASVSRSPTELVPVKPIVELDMVDPRFIDSADVLTGLDSRPNLMELTPGEFEGLITNLFAKMGLDTRQTQASRDGGVDCVAFDQRPIFGGKVVIQAKRYKHTVGVSAVRDLYGTVQNEGASKGILVTTSGYGKASFEFAKGKPLELLDGGNLLHLLKEHAQIDAKILPPDDWNDALMDG